MTTLQELEKINYEDYESKPEDLVKIAKQFLNLKKFEKALEILEKSIRFCIKNNKDDESAVECAKFYYHYADGLIRKCMESDDILAIGNTEEIKEEKIEEESEEKEERNLHRSNIDDIIEQNAKKKNLNEESNSNNNDNENDPNEKEETDEDVAFENLFVAEKIYKTFLARYDGEDPSKIQPEIQTIYFDLSNVYQKFGELEMCRSDFKAAVEFFTKALEVRNKYDNKFSRAIAEIYFNLATVYDFDSKKCLSAYYKTKIIMEYHLKQELLKINQTKLSDEIEISEGELDQEEVKIQNLFKNKKPVESLTEDLLKNEDIEELFAIISELNMKIEDVVVDILDYDKFIKEKQTQQKEPQNNTFTTDYDKSKLIDVNSLGIVKKRQRTEEPEDNTEGGKRSKPDKLDENVININ